MTNKAVPTIFVCLLLAHGHISFAALSASTMQPRRTNRQVAACHPNYTRTWAGLEEDHQTYSRMNLSRHGSSWVQEHQDQALPHLQMCAWGLDSCKSIQLGAKELIVKLTTDVANHASERRLRVVIPVAMNRGGAWMKSGRGDRLKKARNTSLESLSRYIWM
jgi:hypothetical protein